MRHRITDWENNPGAHRDRELPDIVWIGPRPRRWRLPPGSLGWGGRAPSPIPRGTALSCRLVCRNVDRSRGVAPVAFGRWGLALC